ncbi:MAG: hypothetical protein Harvfovirus20_9 [Harvfovirus sp.]|uniref:Uncharacterized protein n=1 Tax=Harvfovirus sp. TaxID=2487768 RepID=A0A3G5A235_9VIRU|nr:MAG: hypothetical protein Harvfovirus20_9 [Harvfovirus sp.]
MNNYKILKYKSKLERGNASGEKQVLYSAKLDFHVRRMLSQIGGNKIEETKKKAEEVPGPAAGTAGVPAASLESEEQISRVKFTKSLSLLVGDPRCKSPDEINILAIFRSILTDTEIPWQVLLKLLAWTIESMITVLCDYAHPAEVRPIQLTDVPWQENSRYMRTNAFVYRVNEEALIRAHQVSKESRNIPAFIAKYKDTGKLRFSIIYIRQLFHAISPLITETIFWVPGKVTYRGEDIDKTIDTFEGIAKVLRDDTDRLPRSAYARTIGEFATLFPPREKIKPFVWKQQAIDSYGFRTEGDIEAERVAYSKWRDEERKYKEADLAYDTGRVFQSIQRIALALFNDYCAISVPAEQLAAIMKPESQIKRVETAGKLGVIAPEMCDYFMFIDSLSKHGIIAQGDMPAILFEHKIVRDPGTNLNLTLRVLQQPIYFLYLMLNQIISIRERGLSVPSAVSLIK